MSELVSIHLTENRPSFASRDLPPRRRRCAGQACPAVPCRNAARRCRSAGPARRPCSAFPTSGSSRSLGIDPIGSGIRGRHGPSGPRPRSALARRPAAAAASRRVGRRRERRFRRGVAVRLERARHAPDLRPRDRHQHRRARPRPSPSSGPDYDPQLRAVYTETPPQPDPDQARAHRRPVRRCVGRQRTVVQDHLALCRRPHAGRHRRGLRFGPPAADRARPTSMPRCR